MWLLVFFAGEIARVYIYIKQKRSNKILLLRPIGITYLNTKKNNKKYYAPQLIVTSYGHFKKYRVNEGKENSSNICS